MLCLLTFLFHEAVGRAGPFLSNVAVQLGGEHRGACTPT
jgi:hypothetical protein